MDDAKTWDLIHQERAAMADTLAALATDQWSEPSACAPWSVQVTAGHILLGAEQTPAKFMKRMAANGFRFNRMMDRDSRRAGALPRHEIVERLRATTTTTNHPPAPIMTMLGEIVVHSEDIRRPLGIVGEVNPEAIIACLDMYKVASFPTGTKKRIGGLRLVATDVDWEHGAGPEVTGTGLSLLVAMTGRPAGLDGLSGEGIRTLTDRMIPTPIAS
ncbi:MAG: maleylpyruvate isomerase family mycothiol-dependent enzyme [Acidimicrobiia bacterium]